MYLAYTPEEDALRAELRAYFATIMTPEVEAEVASGDTGGPHCLAAVEKKIEQKTAYLEKSGEYIFACGAYSK